MQHTKSNTRQIPKYRLHKSSGLGVVRLAGMRPGKVVLMRGCDLETTESIWVYKPMEHKTQHHGRERIIHLGPQAQGILCPLLKPDMTMFLFSPRDAAPSGSAARRTARITPLTPSPRARKPKSNPKRQLGERYTTIFYGQSHFV